MHLLHSLPYTNYTIPKISFQLPKNYTIHKISLQLPKSLSTMVSQFPFYNKFITISFLYLLLWSILHPAKSVIGDTISIPTFAFGWLGDTDTFVAGNVATVKVWVLGYFEPKNYKHAFNPNITVNDKMGNNTYISGVSSHFSGNFNDWRISFTPIMVGLFNVLITDDNFKVFDSSLHFRVTPGPIYPSAGIVSWLGQANEFVAGMKAIVQLLPKDAFGNNVSLAAQVADVFNFDFNVSVSRSTGSIVNIVDITNMGWDESGYLKIEFVVATAGSLLLYVKDRNQNLNGSPLSFKVSRGALDVSSCVPQWNTVTNSFQLFSVMETYVRQQDKYGNLVPGLYPFDVEVVQKGTNLSMPVSADLQFEEIEMGIQLFSFSLVEPGEFVLLIFDEDQNNLITSMPYDFTVYVGYCDSVHSIVNGSGLNNSIAGELARFSVFLKDAYLYPSPVELERFQVQIVRELGSGHVQATISPMEIVNGTLVPKQLHFMEIASAPDGYSHINSARKLRTRASTFEVIYVAEKSGVYQIHVFCGNIKLNSGHPFQKEVRAGEVNMSLSGVAKFSPQVPKLAENEIVVQLMDSFLNPVVSKESKITLEIACINKSGSTTLMFIDNNDGSYTGSYVAKDVGTYEICASFDGKRFFPCPFGVNVYNEEYFPKAYDDLVYVWEYESIAFSTLENDYFSGGKASIIEFLKPNYGSLLQFGDGFRYTPYKGFYGNDSFTYTISDVNGNLASGSVNLSVLSIPPQFVSFPNQLHATEDVISPRFGGFPSFEITYSDVMENISVVVSAKSGQVFLSPMLMEFWQPTWDQLSVNKGGEKTVDLALEGCLETINSALQSIQYLGNQHFYGDDIIRVSAVNKNGKNDLDIPIFVEPINDPPFIDVPKFIILEEKKTEKGYRIFDNKWDKFNFSIGDPDLLSSSKESQFTVMFSVEVNSGYLSTNLPAKLISTTELKLKNSYEWQPLRTFVTISQHFVVKAKGLRFHGTINDCNDVLQHLFYHGDLHIDVLSVRVNDMGRYGCYPDCTEMMSVPLFTEATVSVIKTSPMSSLLAHSLGAAIVIEFIAVLFLGVALLLFMCKCALLLARDKTKHDPPDPLAHSIELTRTQSTPFNLTSRTGLPENVARITRCHSSPLLISWRPDFRWRSNFQSERGVSSSKDPSSNDQNHPQSL